MQKMLFTFFFLFLSCAVSFAEDIKQSEFNGAFYPSNPAELNKMLDDFYTRANPGPVEGEIIGLISPHAGYIYSGAIAAEGYKSLEKDYRTVIIMSPTHRYPFNKIAVYPQGYFATPLGNLEINKELAEKFNRLSFATFETGYFQDEHSVEVQLPFIYKTFETKIKIIPVIFGDIVYEEIKELADFLVELSRQEKILIVASSDMSHFNNYEKAVAIDSDTIKLIEKKDTNALYSSSGYGGGRACGINPIITLLMYADNLGADIKILKYANSGDTAGDKSRVVGYLAAAVFTKAQTETNNRQPASEANNGKKGKEGIMGEYTLNNEEKKALLTIARTTLEAYLKDGKTPKITEPAPGALTANRGAFVTLTKHGNLRGCIGRIIGDTPLYKVVSEFAVHAAVDDSRFEPVTYEELKNIEIEISVLTPFETIKSLDEIVVGTHGLMIQKGFYSGLLLPQVPIDWGWDKETFLKQLCRKAGLPITAYTDKDAIIYKFSAIVFNEPEMKKE